MCLKNTTGPVHLSGAKTDEKCCNNKRKTVDYNLLYPSLIYHQQSNPKSYTTREEKIYWM